MKSIRNPIIRFVINIIRGLNDINHLKKALETYLRYIEKTNKDLSTSTIEINDQINSIDNIEHIRKILLKLFLDEEFKEKADLVGMMSYALLYGEIHSFLLSKKEEKEEKEASSLIG